MEKHIFTYGFRFPKQSKTKEFEIVVKEYQVLETEENFYKVKSVDNDQCATEFIRTPEKIVEKNRVWFFGETKEENYQEAIELLLKDQRDRLDKKIDEFVEYKKAANSAIEFLNNTAKENICKDPEAYKQKFLKNSHRVLYSESKYYGIYVEYAFLESLAIVLNRREHGNLPQSKWNSDKILAREMCSTERQIESYRKYLDEKYGLDKLMNMKENKIGEMIRADKNIELSIIRDIGDIYFTLNEEQKEMIRAQRR